MSLPQYVPWYLLSPLSFVTVAFWLPAVIFMLWRGLLCWSATALWVDVSRKRRFCTPLPTARLGFCNAWKRRCSKLGTFSFGCRSTPESRGCCVAAGHQFTVLAFAGCAFELVRVPSRVCLGTPPANGFEAVKKKPSATPHLCCLRCVPAPLIQHMITDLALS